MSEPIPLFDHLPVGVYRTTADGRLAAANATLVAMLGCETFEELAGRELHGGIVQASYSREAIRLLLERGGEIRGLESVWTRRDGSAIRAREHLRALRAGDGAVAFVEGVVEELGAAGAPPHRKHDAAHPLVVQPAPEAKYRALVELAATAVYEMHLDRDGNFVRPCVSPELELLTGYDPQQFRTFADLGALLHEDDRRALGARWKRFLRGRADVRQWRVVTRSGIVRWLDDFARPVTTNGDGSILILGAVRDVTREKEREAALAFNESRYRTLVESMSEGLLYTDLDDVVLFVNRQFCDITGYTREELIGRPGAALAADDGEAAVLAAKNELRRRGISDSYELRVRHRSGEAIWLQVHGSPTFDAGGGITGTICLSRDITSDKKREAAMRQSEEHLRLVVEAASDPIVVTDDAQTIVFTNSAVQRVFGHAPSDVLSRPLSVIIESPPARSEAARDAVGITRAGTRIPLEVTHGRVVTAGGTRTTWICRDVSDRKREAERQETLTRVLQNVAREWVATFDAVESPMLILDPDLRIRRINRAARDLFGGRYGEIVGRALESFAEREPWTTAAAICRPAEATSRGDSRQLRDASGRSWEVSVRAGTATVFPREHAFLILILRDVTRVVELQEANRRAEVLATLGAVVGGVAHEVRNPLFAISAGLEVFEREASDRADLAGYIPMLRHEVDRLTSLMHDLLEFGKPPVKDHQPAALSDVLYAARLQCLPAMRARGIEVNVTAPGAMTMLMDEHRMTQMFQNLIENAVQHAPPGSIVDVSADADPECPLVHCRVVDRGPGFDEADLPRVFEPFFSRRGGGTGLGLALAQRVVEEHGGSIMIANGARGGAIVDLVLPARSAS